MLYIRKRESMYVSKISLLNQIPFAARTKINAPESLLKEEDCKYFEELGSKIGSDTDVIEITLSDLTPSKRDSSVLIYRCSQHVKINGFNKQTNIDIPYIMRGEKKENAEPKNYLKKFFDRLK